MVASKAQFSTSTVRSRSARAGLVRKRATMTVNSNAPKPKTQVLFCGLEFPSGYQLTKEELRSTPDIEVVSCARDDLREHLPTAHVLVPLMTRLDASLIESAEQAKLIIQYGVGLEGVDIPAATRARIAVANIPSEETGNAASCAEHIIYMVFSLLRDQQGMNSAVQNGLLGQPMGRVLMGSRVLVIGFGAMAEALVPRLKPFGVHITAVRANPWSSSSNGESAAAQMLDAKGQPDDLTALLPSADIVILTCTMIDNNNPGALPLKELLCGGQQNPTTAGLVGDEFLGSMKPGTLLINCARGGLLQYSPVLSALESGHLGGLATDVMWTEPVDPDDPIVKHPKVLVTPHIAGITDVSYSAMAKIIAREVRRIHAGEAPSRQVNNIPPESGKAI